MRNILEARLVDGVAGRTSDPPPCDFCSFVAERRGIDQDQAEVLIEGWVASYEPRARCSRVTLIAVPTLLAEELLGYGRSELAMAATDAA
jgi:hypothetical protein